LVSSKHDMKTLAEQARDGVVTQQMKAVAKAENIDIAVLLERIAKGSVVIMSRGESSVGIGKGLSTKVNANIGTSSLKIAPGCGILPPGRESRG